MDDLRVERILRAVECVPAGRAATYGLIGRVVGEVPRVVGWVMFRWGQNVPWWRIVNASGTIPGHAEGALPHWREEKLLAPGAAHGAEHAPRVELRRVLADEGDLVRAWNERAADLEGQDEEPEAPGSEG